MSKRNSPEVKRAARERLRAERERQARRERRRRQLLVGGVAVVALAGAAGIGVAVTSMSSEDSGGDATDWDAVQAQVDGEGDEGYPSEPPANTSGENGLTIRIGDESAEDTLTLYEDPRCPVCAAFEQAMGGDVRQDVEDGQYQVEYVFGTFLDGNFPGTSGSRNALSALGAALNVSTDAFQDYHEALYSAEYHPSESEDAFGEDARLIEIAQSVPELEGNRQFERDVNNSTYAVWALEMTERFNNSEGVDGTPTLMWNGEVFETPQTVEDFNLFIEENLSDNSGDDSGDGSGEDSDGNGNE